MAGSLPQRKRMRRQETPAVARFITFSCYRRLPLLSNPRICECVLDCLSASRDRHRFELYAWVIMPEHVHLLMNPRADDPLHPALLSFKLAIAKRIIGRWKDLAAPVLPKITTPQGRTRFWQPGGGFDRNTRNLTDFCRHVRYIHNNPVKRGLVETPADWVWSSVHHWRGEHTLSKITCDNPPVGVNWGEWRGFE